MKFWNSLAFLETDQLLPMARLSEELGFHGVTVSDHVVHPEKIESPYPYTADGKPMFREDAEWPDPWVLIGALSTVTTRLHFTTNVYVVPARNVLSVAKTLSTAAVLSGGRVALGMGAGWMREEFDLLGQQFAGRGKRMDEMVEAMRLLWSGDVVEYHGDHVDFDRLHISPVPPQPIPIWVGGHSDIALRRAARLDGWMGNLYQVDEAVAYAEKLREARRAAGTLDRDDYEAALAVYAMPTPDVVARLEDAGVTSLLNAPWMFGGSTWDERRAAMERFAEEVF
ncbi:MAG TPA: TIGR03619 family F420-dependent LLM class oxidoreductase [Acidimicrobiales bacterium]|nr:TIGR03619 family F420-dependent LLM class oxidoreductase [Acidimicrobiales bacterium]